MKVFFVGAGPGAKDLITVRGAEILKRVSFVMYAGSLVPPEVLCYCRPDAEIIDTAKLDLEQHPLSLNSCIEDALDLLASKASDKGLELAFIRDLNAPETIIGDSSNSRPVVQRLSAAHYRHDRQRHAR